MSYTDQNLYTETSENAASDMTAENRGDNRVNLIIPIHSSSKVRAIFMQRHPYDYDSEPDIFS